MSAPQIPNLNSLRRGGSRGRGKDGVGVIGRKSKDEVIQETDNDAASSRLSAVEAGYLEDSFSSLLTTATLQRRLPLMNRGTYVRTVGIDKIVQTFLESQPGRKQIISLGAGSDTRFFRLKQQRSDLDLVYHEIDFTANTKTKIDQIKDASKIIHRLCSLNVDDFVLSDGNLASPDYYVHAQDLRMLSEALPGVDTSLPTLLISECCLIYLSPDEAENVLNYFTGIFSSAPLAIAIYEPIRPNDAFGRTMVRNLTTRGIHLQTLEKHAELKDQRQRLQDHGFEPHAEDIDFIWRKWIDDKEKDRVERLEWMDEIEEYVLFAQHYCISWGWKGWPKHVKWALPSSQVE